MTTFTITANGICCNYEATSAEDAIIAYVRDAGYQTIAEAAEVCGQSEEEFLAEITVTEVK